MPTPPFSRELAQKTIQAILDAYEDGFELIRGGRPSARIEGARRLDIPVNTMASRLRAAELYYGMRLPDIPPPRKSKPSKPSAPPPGSAPWAPRPAKQDDLPAAVRAILMKRHATLPELARATMADAEAVVNALNQLRDDGTNIIHRGEIYEIAKFQQASYVDGPVLEIISRPDNTYLFGACGDQHIGSKYFREDVASDVYERYSRAGVQAAFNTGNWIDGEARFNKHDLAVHGMAAQLDALSELYPRGEGFDTYAVVGRDHEGWYEQREGVNIGQYAETVMRSKGRKDWHHIGLMESHVILKNANTGKTATLAVVHPGGGSAYALSYSIQKIVESLEGGEKPHVAFYGHYHKLWSGNIRNIWCFQTGCAQDQTPFMRQRRLEAHVGAYLAGLEQDPETGAIIACTATCYRYFNRSYYGEAVNNRWSSSSPVKPLIRTIGGV